MCIKSATSINLPCVIFIIYRHVLWIVMNHYTDGLHYSMWAGEIASHHNCTVVSFLSDEILKRYYAKDWVAQETHNLTKYQTETV